MNDRHKCEEGMMRGVKMSLILGGLFVLGWGGVVQAETLYAKNRPSR